MSDGIRVNGNQLSWGSIVLKLRSEDYYGFTAISYADKIERVKAYGMGRHHAPRGRSRGKYTVENVKLTGWKSSVQIFREALAQASLSGSSYGNVEFVCAVLYSEPDEPNVAVEIGGCVFTSNSSSEEESPDPLKEDVELDVMYIRRNGLVLFEDSEGSPAA